MICKVYYKDLMCFMNCCHCDINLMNTFMRKCHEFLSVFRLNLNEGLDSYQSPDCIINNGKRAYG